MTVLRLLWNSLCYYWRTNLAALCGVVVGTAVIGGALLVGDSVRYSLQRMTYDRLGNIDHALTGPRFFREQLAEELAADPAFGQRFETAAPALMMTGAFVFRQQTGDASPGGTSATEGGTSSRLVGGVTVYGVDERLWKLTKHGGADVPRSEEVVLNRRVAVQLGVRVGDEVTLSIELPAAIPRDSLLGNRNQTTVEIPLTVKSILDADVPVSRLSLLPNQQLPLVAFVSLPFLQEQLGLQRTVRNRVRGKGPNRRRVRVVKPARINAIFFRAKQPSDRDGATAPQAAHTLTKRVQQHLQLADLYLRVVPHQAGSAARPYLSLESEQQILPEALGEAGLRAAKTLKVNVSPVLVYLANELLDVKLDAVLNHQAAIGGSAGTLAVLQHQQRKGDEWGWYSRYSVVAGLDIDRLRKPPFGPFQFVGPAPSQPLGEKDILLNEWLAEDLRVQPGDTIVLRYHLVGAHIVDERGRLPEKETTFTVRGIVKLDGTPADDRGLTPEVEGITDKDSFDEWERPFEMKDVTPRDDLYWKRYRATPKAFVSLATAQKLWGSRYGRLTSVRVALLPGLSTEEAQRKFSAEVLRQLTPEQTQLVVRPVKYEGLQAASGTVDFSGLFFAFSFFLILSAVILVGLLFRLGMERRSDSVGLLAALGFTPSRSRWLFLAEGSVVVVLGGLLGLLAAWGYAAAMIYGLKHWWYGAIRTRFLFLAVQPLSLLYGFAGSVFVAVMAVVWALRYFRSFSIRELLSGAKEPAAGQLRRHQFRQKRRSWYIAFSCVLLSVLLLSVLLVGWIPQDQEAFEGFSWQVVAFFVVGVLLLAGGLTGLAAWLDADKAAAVRGRGLAGLLRLGLRNAARHRQRSLMTVALIASATFLIVAVAAGHRNPAVETPSRNSGNGGYTLLARSSTPLLHNLNTSAGRVKLQLDLSTEILAARNRLALAEEEVQQAAAAGKTETAQRRRQQAEETRRLIRRLQRQENLLQQMHVTAFRVQPGEDASCLNIYQTRLPTILGVPADLRERGGFKFVGTRRDNPWSLLTEQHAPEDGVPVYPVVGDMNTLQYSLHKGVGETISVPDEENPRYKLKIVGRLDGSVFQGVLLMSVENFVKLFPDRVGYRYFLIEVPFRNAEQWRRDTEELQSLLESRLAPYGFDTEPVAAKIADFLAVQNTYLSTFQTLGGLGLLLGTLGLATVMLRNVLERRPELALLRAVGFQPRNISWLVVVENAFLLLWGLLTGTVSALLAMLPHLTSISAAVPWVFLSAVLLGVFLAGMLAAAAAVAAAVRTPLVATLRSE